jgi:hypothetical protein
MQTSDGTAHASGWLVLFDGGEPQLIPIDDLRDHEPSAECWCGPERVDGVVEHRAMDKREEYERGRRFC